jgi:hypothetical protein
MEEAGPAAAFLVDPGLLEASACEAVDGDCTWATSNGISPLHKGLRTKQSVRSPLCFQVLEVVIVGRK